MGRKPVPEYNIQIQELSITAQRLACPKCGYSWIYKGIGKWVQCPKCKFQFKIKNRIIDNEPIKEKCVACGTNKDIFYNIDEWVCTKCIDNGKYDEYLKGQT